MFHLIVPVRDRIKHTEAIIECIRQQTILQKVSNIIIVDDGSTDGTTEFLARQPDITTLSGDGNLWWGGAVHKGLKWLAGVASENDVVVLLNDDTYIPDNYLESLERYHNCYPNALIGCPLYEEYEGSYKDAKLISIGPMVNINRVAIWDKLQELDEFERANLSEIYEVSALAGRGMLIPYKVILKFGAMRPKILPHYLADYEFSMRMKKNGYALLIASEAKVYSPPVFGSTNNRYKGISKYFKKGSPNNIITFALFFMLVGNVRQRLLSPLTVFYFRINRAIISRTIKKEQ